MTRWIGTFLVGAIVCTALDHRHVTSGVLAYARPTFGGQPWWAPLLFGAATVAAVGAAAAVRRLVRAAPCPPPSSWLVAADAGAFVAAYGLTSIAHGSPTLLAAALATGWLARAIVGLPAWAIAYSVALAIVAPAVEATLAAVGIFRYAHPDLAGVPRWLPGMYLFGGVAAVSLARAVSTRRCRGGSSAPAVTPSPGRAGRDRGPDGDSASAGFVAGIDVSSRRYMGFLFFGKRGPRLKTRADLLNHLIATRSYRRYLEIGVRDPRQNFDKIRAAEKHGVDPAPERPISHPMTSDAFFAQREANGDRTPYDLAFIDGLHLADQVERDILNCLACLSPDGSVVLHDCNPLTEDAQTDDYDGRKHWNGTVWKAWVKLRATRPDLSMWVVDMDEGCGVIRRGAQAPLSPPSLEYAKLDYAYLAQNRSEALNLVSVDEFLKAVG